VLVSLNNLLSNNTYQIIYIIGQKGIGTERGKNKDHQVWEREKK